MNKTLLTRRSPCSRLDFGHLLVVGRGRHVGHADAAVHALVRKIEEVTGKYEHESKFWGNPSKNSGFPLVCHPAR